MRWSNGFICLEAQSSGGCCMQGNQSSVNINKRSNTRTTYNVTLMRSPNVYTFSAIKKA